MLTKQDRPLWVFLIGFFFQTIPGAMLAPLLTLSLAARGVEAALIGALATAGSLAYMLSLPATPALIRRFGAVATLRAALLVSTAAVAGLALTDWPGLWVALYAALGFAAGLRYTIAESWVPALAAADARGRALALSQTIVGASAFLGSGLLLLTGIEGDAPHLIAVAAAVIGAALLWFQDAPAATAGPGAGHTWGGLRGLLVQVGPMVLGASLLGGLFEAGLAVALPLFGLELGMGPALAAGLVTALGLGSLGQYPFGALADRLPWGKVVLGTASVIAASALLLPLAPRWPWLLLGLGVVWGGAGGGLYTLAAIRNGDLWRGPQLVGASVVTQFAYMIGEAAGPALSGLAIERSPAYGLPALVAGAGALGLAVMLGASRAPRAELRPPLAAHAEVR